MTERSSFRATAIVAFSLLALFGVPGTATAQGSGNIQGTVTDSASRRPVIGAQVSVAGSNRATLTDEAGRYALRGVPAGSVVLRVTRLGYAVTERRRTLAANETATEDFSVRTAATVLSEVVVTGYGTASRAEVSSAVAQVSGQALIHNPVAGVDAALQGKAPGVQVIQNAGNPGNGITVRVRGSASLSASNQPLYVVDGMPIVSEDPSQFGFGGQDLTSVTGLSPDEIESIDVLKDAAAGAIYGSRASNGVVQITTKRGRPGRSRFSFSSYYGQQNIANKIELLNAKEYVAFFNEGAFNDGYCGTAATIAQCAPGDLPFTAGVDDVVSTDWQAEILRTAPVGDYSLSVTGGSDRLNYLLSGSIFEQKGIIKSSDYNRRNGRLNVDFAANDKLTFRTSLGLARELWHRIENDNTIIGPGTNAIAEQPNIAPRRPDGNYADNSTEGLEYVNPVAYVNEFSSPATSLRAIGGVDAMYDFTPRLRLTGRVGADVNSFRERSWESPRVPDTYAASVNGVASQATTATTRYLSEGFLTYEALRSDLHTLSVTGGGGVELNYSEFTSLTGEGFGSNFTQYPSSAGKITSGNGSATAHNLVSGFARANYSAKDKYLVTASFRTDGSSRFGENNRYGFFPSVSFGWKATEESFLQSLKDFTDLKLRASYGVTGNQGISNFAFLGTYTRANFAGEPGIGPGNFENPDLRWEATKEMDIGFDMSFLGGRLAFIGDWYKKNTEDLLVSRPVSSTSGYTSVWDNVGNIENSGVELQVTATPVQASATRGFEWTTDFNISKNDNKVTKLHRNGPCPPAPAKCAGEPFNSGIRSVNRVEEGVPLGAFHLIKFTGVDPATGDAKHQDLNGDGLINADDRQIVGSPHPDFFGGLRNQLSWKGFDVNTFFEFSQGFEVFNAMRIFADDGGYYFDNKFRDVLRRWQKPGDQTDMPRASYDGTSGARTVSSRFVEDGSYVRFQEITFGYTLPSSISSRARFSNARLFVSGRNLKTWTDYSAYDPDVNSNGSGSNISLGTDFYAYPRAKTVSIGITGNW
jgi:TonB-linked SusC/RagA family outer membrane protein